MIAMVEKGDEIHPLLLATHRAESNQWICPSKGKEIVKCNDRMR
jgi:hypothetical protein